MCLGNNRLDFKRLIILDFKIFIFLFRYFDVEKEVKLLKYDIMIKGVVI